MAMASITSAWLRDYVASLIRAYVGDVAACVASQDEGAIVD